MFIIYINSHIYSGSSSQCKEDKERSRKLTYLQNRFTDTENRLVVAKEKAREGGKDWQFRVSRLSRCKLVYTGWITNKVLLYSTGNYNQ